MEQNLVHEPMREYLGTPKCNMISGLFLNWGQFIAPLVGLSVRHGIYFELYLDFGVGLRIPIHLSKKCNKEGARLGPGGAERKCGVPGSDTYQPKMGHMLEILPAKENIPYPGIQHKEMSLGQVLASPEHPSRSIGSSRPGHWGCRLGGVRA